MDVEYDVGVQIQQPGRRRVAAGTERDAPEGAIFVTLEDSLRGQQPVTLAEIRETWPPTVDVARAGRAFDMSRNHAYGLASRGEFPAKVIKVGHRYKVVTESIIRALSESEPEPPLPHPSPPANADSRGID